MPYVKFTEKVWHRLFCIKIGRGNVRRPVLTQKDYLPSIVRKSCFCEPDTKPGIRRPTISSIWWYGMALVLPHILNASLHIHL
eukprot:scaffold2310_cov164-Amphora_coffeaeformis.AAC.6